MCIFCTPFLFSPRTILVPLSFFPFLSFPLSVSRAVLRPSDYLSRVSRERNAKGTRVRTCTGLRRVTRASQLGKCEIISAFCHVPPTCPLPTLPSFPLPSYLPSNHACSLVNPTTASTPITNARRPFHHSARFTDRLLQISSCHPTPLPPHRSTANGTHGRMDRGELIYTPSSPFLLRAIRARHGYRLFLPLPPRFSPPLSFQRVKSSTSSSFLSNIRFRPRSRSNPADQRAYASLGASVFSRIPHEKRV